MRHSRRTMRGQVIVIFVLAAVVMIGMIGLVVDGSSLLAQQRVAQNGADAAATSGTVQIASKIGGTPKTNADVWNAIDQSATTNALKNWSAEYTNDFGQPIGQAVTNDGSPVPAAALGVIVHGSRPASTTFSGVLGFSEFVASADATVVAGALDLDCVASVDGCLLLPMTFPVVVFSCDELGNIDGTEFPFPPPPGGNDFEGGKIWPTVTDPAQMTANNMAILPLCKLNPGSVGWLDLQPGSNLAREISDPPNRTFDLPDWFQTQPGNANSVEDELNAYSNSPVLLPMFTETCRIDPGEEPCPPEDTGTGRDDEGGNNTWYHIQAITTFWLDRAYTEGGNVDECTRGPGQPVQDIGPGFLGCLKGWFVKYSYSGPITPGGVSPDYNGPIGIQLIR